MTPDERYDWAVTRCTHVSCRPCGACVARAIDEAEAEVLKAPGGVVTWLRNKRREIAGAETANEAERAKLDGMPKATQMSRRAAMGDRRGLGGKPNGTAVDNGDKRREYWNRYYQCNKAKILAKANARNAQRRDSERQGT